jgi:hypothetical protein
MLAVFCLRLGIGMLAVLLILPPAQVHPRFYRTHFLVALGLSGLALWGAWNAGTALMLGLIGAAAALAFLAAVVWSLEGAPGGRTLIVLTCAALVAALVFMEKATPRGETEVQPLASSLAGDLTSAALLGSALTAMLLGHSYLIAPGMSMTPTFRLLAAFAVAVLLRMAADGFALWRWTAANSLGTLNSDDLLWLPVRWVAGFVLPLILGWMTWQTARIRSTQSATGILYAGVILCILGELTSQLLREKSLCL